MYRLFNAGQKFCRMLLSTFIKLPSVFKIFDLSIFEWHFYTGFTVIHVTCGLDHTLRIRGAEKSFMIFCRLFFVVVF